MKKIRTSIIISSIAIIILNLINLYKYLNDKPVGTFKASLDFTFLLLGIIIIYVEYTKNNRVD